MMELLRFRLFTVFALVGVFLVSVAESRAIQPQSKKAVVDARRAGPKKAVTTLPPGIPPVSGPIKTQFVMQVQDIVVGNGEEAQPGQVYRVHYTGWLASNGAKFDSSLDRNEPFEFVQGLRKVITGWDQGFEGMRVGGKRRLFIPYQLAYGVMGRGEIPPKANLIFDVELLGVQSVAMVTPGREPSEGTVPRQPAQPSAPAQPKAPGQPGSPW